MNKTVRTAVIIITIGLAAFLFGFGVYMLITSLQWMTYANVVYFLVAAVLFIFSCVGLIAFVIPKQAKEEKQE